MPSERDKIGETVAKAMREIGYLGVGTVEFLYEDGEFYFIEMNTRLQVEHPVTEMITGIDLVREQIRVAAGAELALKQKDIKFSGHAIECRINAENPVTFRPSPGRINAFHAPGGLGVRVDSAVYPGYTIPPYYDTLIGKLIVHGKTRNECLMRLKRALDEFVVDGIDTTIPLFHALVREPDIIDGDYHIHWLEHSSPGRDGALERRLRAGVLRRRHGQPRKYLHRDHAGGAAQGLCLRHLSDGGKRRRPCALLDRAGPARHHPARPASTFLRGLPAPCAPTPFTVCGQP